MKTLLTLKKNTYAIHLLEGNNGLCVMAENKEGNSDFPIQYTDKRIAYDNPELYPKYIKKLVPFMFECLDALRFAKKYPGWHTYAKDGTEAAIKFLKLNELVTTNEFDQFKAL